MLKRTIWYGISWTQSSSNFKVDGEQQISILNCHWQQKPAIEYRLKSMDHKTSVTFITLCYVSVVCMNDNNIPLRWRHNDHAGVSNHQPHGCLLNRSFMRKSKKTSKLRVTGLCVGNSPGTGEFPAQMASYAENVSIWWRHHAGKILQLVRIKRHDYF